MRSRNFMLSEKITNDIKEAMKAKDEARVSALRMLHSALKNKRIEIGHDLSDEEVVKVAQTLVKQYKDGVLDFKKGNRDDLVTKTEAEIAFLSIYLPTEASEDEVRRVVETTIKELNAVGTKDFGKVMSAVTKALGATASGNVVSKVVREVLG